MDVQGEEGKKGGLTGANSRHAWALAEEQRAKQGRKPREAEKPNCSFSGTYSNKLMKTKSVTACGQSSAQLLAWRGSQSTLGFPRT